MQYSQGMRKIVKDLRGTWPWFLLTTLSGVVEGLFMIPQIYLFAKLITGIPTHMESSSMVMRMLWLLGFLILVRGICRYVVQWAGTHLAIRVKTKLRSSLSLHLLQQGLSEVNQQQVGEWIHTAYTDIESVEPFIRFALPQIVLAIVIPAAVLIVVFFTDWISGLILFTTAQLIPFFMILLGRVARQKTQKQWAAMRRLGAHFYEVIEGLTTLKLFNRSQAQRDVVAKVGERYRKATMDTLKVAFLSSFAMELISTIGTAMVAVGVGLRLLSGHLSFTHALLTIMLAGEFYLPLRSLGSQFHASMEGRLALQHLGDILNTSPMQSSSIVSDNRVQDPVMSASDLTLLKDRRPILRVEQMTFTYPETQEPVLKDVSLSVAAGEHIAVVGSSGAGKSTLFSLLIGALRPQTGAIYVHGEPLCEGNISAWRRDISYLGQRPHIFSASVLENIRMSRPSAELDEVWRVAEQAGVHSFVHLLPQGYETKIGSGGMSLSSGQVQRIAVARMLLKPCSIWLLDEPTAHLDVESERWFREVIHRLPSSQTVLIIAHRLSTVERMDKVFVVRNGRVTTIESRNQGDQRQLDTFQVGG
ncbi:MAG: thiol reductant ABC exporter subunit CydD [Firmicutes bacterium]|nr:thiol reductant ABC exporter subunit CydD [Bacillota bacterium]